MGVHQIEMNPSVKKNLVSVFLENKRVNPSLKANDSSMMNFLKGNAKDAHIKNFNSVIPSFKHGES